MPLAGVPGAARFVRAVRGVAEIALPAVDSGQPSGLNPGAASIAGLVTARGQWRPQTV